MRSLAFVAVVIVLAAPGAGAQDLRLATWNIQTLSTGKPVFPNQPHVRGSQDIAFLKNFAAQIAADAIALQEIASPAAATQLFPPAEWTICISGQFFEAYPSLGRPAKAECFASAPMPDTPASEEFARQFTAFAVRKNAGLAVTVADAAEFGVLHRDREGVVRPTRWGLVATIAKEGRTFTLLNVHLKSGCFHDRVTLPLAPPPSATDCETFARQVPMLDRFVRTTPQPFIVLGDFNRRLDLTGDQVWARLTGEDSRGDRSDNTGLKRFPFKRPSNCLPDPRVLHEYVAIDYILISDGLKGSGFREYSPDIPANANPFKFKEAFGDHCPKSLTVAPE